MNQEKLFPRDIIVRIPKIVDKPHDMKTANKKSHEKKQNGMNDDYKLFVSLVNHINMKPN